MCIIVSGTLASDETPIVHHSAGYVQPVARVIIVKGGRICHMSHKVFHFVFQCLNALNLHSSIFCFTWRLINIYYL